METFHSKIDIWLLVIMISTTILCIVIAILIGVAEGIASLWISALTVLLGAGLPIWILLSTQYRVSENTLKICSGPFKWNIPLASISSVRDTKNPLSSPALSLDRLEIRYGRGKAVMISPVNKSKFRSAIGFEEADGDSASLS